MKQPRRKKMGLSGEASSRTGSDGEVGRYSIDVLNRAINILSVFSHARPLLSLGEVVQLVELPKTTVFRILSSLVQRRFCEFDPVTGKYSLGFDLLRLADIRRRQNNVHDVSLPIMREIRNAVNETVILSVRSGDSRVHIDFVEGLHAMRRMADLGVQAPLYVGAASKMLLAGMDDEEIEDYLLRTELVPFQDTTITDKSQLWREIRAIRKRGYSESRGELFSGGGALAAPIKDYSGKTVGVIDILTPVHRYSAQHRELCVNELLNGVQRASERLGYRPETDRAQVMRPLRRSAASSQAR